MILRHGVQLKSAGKDIKSQNPRVIMKRWNAKGVRKFERELNISVTDFPQFGLIGPRMNDFCINPCEQTQRDPEDYELQSKQEQELDPYGIEPEPNLLKEQAEYYKRIHRELMGDFSDDVW